MLIGSGKNLVDAHAWIHGRIGVLEHHPHRRGSSPRRTLERGQVAPIQLDTIHSRPLKTHDSRPSSTYCNPIRPRGRRPRPSDGNRHAVHGGNNALVALEEAGNWPTCTGCRGLLDVEQDLRGHQRGFRCALASSPFFRVSSFWPAEPWRRSPSCTGRKHEKVGVVPTQGPQPAWHSSVAHASTGPQTGSPPAG